jgi:hypothetical protein
MTSLFFSLSSALALLLVSLVLVNIFTLDMSPTAVFSTIKTTVLSELGTNTKITASTLWQDKPVLIHLVRRPGCQFCREQASVLVANRDLITTKLGVELVAVVHEEKGADIFQNDYFKGPVYYDESKDMFKALHGGSLRWGGLSTFFSGTFLSNYRRNRASNVKGNLEGEGRIFGGLLVVGKGDEGILFEFQEKTFGDQPALQDVLQACAKATGRTLDQADIEEALKKASSAQSQL